MSEKQTLLFSFPKHSPDMRMLLDRVLEPDTAHPLVRDLLDSLRSARFGEAHFCLQEIQRQLGVSREALQEHLGCLMFANALHSHAPYQGFQYLIDSLLIPASCSTFLMEHLVLGNYFPSDRNRSVGIFQWLMKHGAIVEPDSKAAWKALEVLYPDVFADNHSHYEAKKLDAYITSQALEVREVTRL